MMERIMFFQNIMLRKTPWHVEHLGTQERIARQ